MSYQSIDAKANAIRDEQRLEGITKEFVADVFKDVNDTKANHTDLTKYTLLDDFKPRRTQTGNYVCCINPTTGVIGNLSTADVAQTFALSHRDQTLQTDRRVNLNNRRLFFDTGASTSASRVGIGNMADRGFIDLLDLFTVFGDMRATRYRFDENVTAKPNSIYSKNGDLYFMSFAGIESKLNQTYSPTSSNTKTYKGVFTFTNTTGDPEMGATPKLSDIVNDFGASAEIDMYYDGNKTIFTINFPTLSGYVFTNDSVYISCTVTNAGDTFSYVNDLPTFRVESPSKMGFMFYQRDSDSAGTHQNIIMSIELTVKKQ